jgi:hypothetical protein
MRTETTTRTLYTFDELSDQAKEKARDWYRQGIGEGYDWWEDVYENAATIGLKIAGFDLGRAREIDGEFTDSAQTVVDNIKANHGEHCETYKTAAGYDGSFTQMSDPAMLEDDEEPYEIDDEDAIDDFRKALLEDYLIMLDHEWDYLNSDEAVDEGITANEYEFTEDGNIA